MLKGSQISLKTPMKNTGGVANIPPKNIIDTSTVTIVDQSPKLKPKNMSRFDVLKSIFEPQNPPNLDEKINPKNVSFVGNTHKYYPPESKSKKNGEISSKIRAFSRLRSEYMPSDLNDLKNSRQNADEIASCNRVVGLLNPGKASPQSDMKSRKKKSNRSFMKHEGQN